MPSLSAQERDALMSALADGLGSAEQSGCALWRDDAQARATWHAYHLIGDVLRSEDLATSPGHDAAFLAGVRARLASEPTVLAPEPIVASDAMEAPAAPAAARAVSRRTWFAPAALAAGFVAVAGVLVVTRLSSPQVDSPVMASNPTTSAPGFTLASNNTPLPSAAPLVVEGRLIRNPALDAYLRAHREGLGGGLAAVPGGLPRSVETLAPVTPVTPVSAAVER